MKTFLNGVEYKAYREIMREVGVRFGCINFSYLWFRTPRFNVEDCSFFDELMVVPGGITTFEMGEYVHFLNANSENISFALELATVEHTMLEMDCKVKIIPHGPWYQEPFYVNHYDSLKPFLKTQYKRLAGQGYIIHGDQVDWEFLTSRNSSTWMRGTAGLMSDFRQGKLKVGFAQYATTIARRLIAQGYDIDLKLIKKQDWEELAKMNCIVWKIQQDMEV